jgi:hypothetical protein
MLLAVLAGCNQDSGPSKVAIPVADNPAPPAIAISGSPTTSVVVGVHYEFTPSITAGGGSQVAFSIQNKPPWASFDVATGRLIGVPNAADTGTYAGILIAASDSTSSSSLPKFEITVSPANDGGGAAAPSASLSWTAPTKNSDGTPLTDLSGYRIYYGNTPDALTQQIAIDNAGITEYVVTNLSAGVWYFALKAYNSMNEESNLSPIVQKTL